MPGRRTPRPCPVVLLRCWGTAVLPGAAARSGATALPWWCYTQWCWCDIVALSRTMMLLGIKTLLHY